MSTVVFRDAWLLVDGASLTGELNELSVEAGAESLDATVFGATTRIHKGGLLIGKISGSGYAALGDNAAEQLLQSRMATDDTVLAAFPDGITEGTATKKGYAMLGVVLEFTLGGAVGVLLPFTFAAESRDPG